MGPEMCSKFCIKFEGLVVTLWTIHIDGFSVEVLRRNYIRIYNARSYVRDNTYLSQVNVVVGGHCEQIMNVGMLEE